MLMKVKMTRMRTERIAITSPRLNLIAGVPLLKKPSTASPHLPPKFLRLPVRLLLSYWILADRYPPSPRTARMGMVLHSMTTIATPGFPFRLECQSHPATLSQLSHRPFPQNFLHRSAATHKARNTLCQHSFLNRCRHHLSHRHPPPRHLTK
jgi:hypothetical protein